MYYAFMGLAHIVLGFFWWEGHNVRKIFVQLVKMWWSYIWGTYFQGDFYQWFNWYFIRDSPKKGHL